PVSILAKPVTLAASKTYDGSTSLSGAVTVGTGISGEALTYTGATVSDANVATSSKFINTIMLADGTAGLASNYRLPTLDHANASASILAKPVTLAASKTYDGSTSLSGAVTVGTGINGEALTYTGATASDVNVATSGNFINAIVLADGTGGLASNYRLPILDNTNAPVTIIPVPPVLVLPTQISSVAPVAAPEVAAPAVAAPEVAAPAAAAPEVAAPAAAPAG
ncbi:MAG: YDG domain-containing protein, partial [Burkholderiaceae bacterium]